MKISRLEKSSERFDFVYRVASEPDQIKYLRIMNLLRHVFLLSLLSYFTCFIVIFYMSSRGRDTNRLSD